jgi:hypothetical protein
MFHWVVDNRLTPAQPENDNYTRVLEEVEEKLNLLLEEIKQLTQDTLDTDPVVKDDTQQAIDRHVATPDGKEGYRSRPGGCQSSAISPGQQPAGMGFHTDLGISITLSGRLLIQMNTMKSAAVGSMNGYLGRSLSEHFKICRSSKVRHGEQYPWLRSSPHNMTGAE